MRKHRFYLWIFLLVLLGTAAYLILHNPWSTSAGKFNKLLLKEENTISAIVITDGIDSVHIERKGTVWYSGSEELNSTAVNNLVYTAGNLTLKGFISDGQLKEVRHKAELIIWGKKKVICHLEFLASARVYCIHSPGVPDMYEVDLPGHEGLQLEKVFSTELNHYRKHVIIDLLPDDIATINIWPLSGKAFFVRSGSSGLSVFESDGNTEIVEQIDPRKIQMLLTYFSAIRYDSVLSTAKVFPGGLPDQPLAKIEITTREGVDHKLEVFPLYDTEKHDVDLFFAAVRYNGNEPLLKMNYYFLDLLMRGVEHYYR